MYASARTAYNENMTNEDVICPACGHSVGRTEHETVTRALGAFLTTDQIDSVFEHLSMTLGLPFEKADPDALCRTCLVDAMAGAA